MPSSEQLNEALHQALERCAYTTEPPSHDASAVHGRCLGRRTGSLPYLPERSAPQLLSRLSTESASLLKSALDSKQELRQAILELMPEGIKENWRNGLVFAWSWPDDSPMARRKPVKLRWLLNIANWFEAYSPGHGGAEIGLTALARAAFVSGGLRPGSVLAEQIGIWARRLDPRQIRLFENLLVRDPDEPFLRACLCHYHRLQDDHWGHILWHIQRCPESSMLEGICTFTLGMPDSVHCGLLKAWAEQIRHSPDNIHVLHHAARQLEDREHKLCFLLYHRCSILQPTNSTWLTALAEQVEEHAAADQKVKSLEFYRAAYERSANDEARRSARLEWMKACFRCNEFRQAEDMANELLFTAHSNHLVGLEIHECHLLLGHLALLAGQKPEARQHLLDAGRAPEFCTLMSFGPSMCLAYDMLFEDESEAVLEYLELCKSFWPDASLDHWANDIRRGHVPDFGSNINYSRLRPRQ